MAQKVQVVLTCDLDEETEGVETVTFGLEGHSYVLEACEAHREQLNDALGPFIEVARREGGARRRSEARSSTKAPSARSDKEEMAAIREWGRANGWEVSERGRISAALRNAYTEAQG